MYPFISFFGLNIPSYGLCMCIALFVCALFIFARAKKYGVDVNDLIILFAIAIGSAMLCGSALYIFVTYDIETIIKEITSGNFSFIKNTGIVFYGGLIGGVLGVTITLKILKMKTELVERCAIPFVPLGHAIGRIGCLLAGCCYGIPYEGKFAVSTMFDAGDQTYFPIQGVEAFFNVLIAVILVIYSKKERPKYSILCLYLCLYSCLRFCLEYFRGDAIRGSFFVFSTSQWISMILALTCVIMIIRSRIMSKAK